MLCCFRSSQSITKLDIILKTESFRDLYINQLKRELCVENLLFLETTSRYFNKFEENPKDQESIKENLNEIYDEFIRHGAENEVGKLPNSCSKFYI